MITIVDDDGKRQFASSRYFKNEICYKTSYKFQWTVPSCCFLFFIVDAPYVFVEQVYRVSESDGDVPVTVRREGNTDVVGSVGM